MARRFVVLALVAISVGLWSSGSCSAEEKGRKKRPEGGNPQLREKMKERILAKFDKNGNGQLDPNEREAAKAARKARGDRPKK